MTRHIIAIFLFFLSITSCKNSVNVEDVNGLKIDPNIKSTVEQNIESVKELNEVNDKMQIYSNSLFTDSYQHDTLLFSSKNIHQKIIFKSFYYWNGDTLNIDGAYGLFGGTGFCIKTIKKDATLYHMLSSDDFPSYCYKPNDSLIYRLEVPCTDIKIILSEIPDSTKKQIIYGYVEFKSKDFYSSSGETNGKEDLPRIKCRNNMKIYFKSGYLAL